MKAKGSLKCLVFISNIGNLGDETTHYEIPKPVFVEAC